MVTLRYFAAGKLMKAAISTARAVNDGGALDFRISCLNPRPEIYSIPFCVHHGTMEPM